MIHIAVQHIVKYLNQYLRNEFELNEDVVLISNIVDQDGSIAVAEADRMVVSLVNIEKDAYVGSTRGISFGADRVVKSSPPLYLNLYIMFSAYFSGKNYLEALKFLSFTTRYFQAVPIFDHQTTPDLDKQIEKLTLEIVNLDFQELSHLWGVISGKYIPSILYKVRMVTIDAGDIKAQVPVLTGTTPSINN